MQNLGWQKKALQLAAIYNILWGLYAVVFPYHFFELINIPSPRYIEFWQCIGMIVGVYGIGYWLASKDHLTHYPIILVGFLGKVFGPIGFVQAVLLGKLPAAFGYTIMTNDLIWWIPFFLMLKERYDHDKFNLSGK